MPDKPPLSDLIQGLFTAGRAAERRKETMETTMNDVDIEVLAAVLNLTGPASDQTNPSPLSNPQDRT